MRESIHPKKCWYYSGWRSAGESWESNLFFRRLSSCCVSHSSSFAIPETRERKAVFQTLTWWWNASQLSESCLLPPQFFWTVNMDLLPDIIVANSVGRAKSPASLTVMWAANMGPRLKPVQTKNRAMGRDLIGLQDERRSQPVTKMKANDKE